MPATVVKYLDIRVRDIFLFIHRALFDYPNTMPAANTRATVNIRLLGKGSKIFRVKSTANFAKCIAVSNRKTGFKIDMENSVFLLDSQLLAPERLYETFSKVRSFDV